MCCNHNCKNTQWVSELCTSMWTGLLEVPYHNGESGCNCIQTEIRLKIRNFWPTYQPTSATKKLCGGQFHSLHFQPLCDSACMCSKWPPLVWIFLHKASMYEIWPCEQSMFLVICSLSKPMWKWAAIHSVATGAKTTRHCLKFQFVNLPRIAELLFCTFSCNKREGSMWINIHLLMDLSLVKFSPTVPRSDCRMSVLEPPSCQLANAVV